MKNIKDQIYEALAKVFENVSDQYPKDWVDLPAIQYTEEDNKGYEYCSEGESKSYVRYRIDIWDNKSTSEAALKVDGALTDLGLRRTQCQDAPDPSGMKHKVMRYEMIIDLESDETYWPD
ncbi:MAG: hypothetical protein PHE06_12860 [Lachnospiraceae bacterium]|nr:hypothetical protein [Lachnospiraceae bacterium]